MSGHQVDYDQIAATYDRRFDGQGPRGIGTTLLALAEEIGAQRILEVGCGTGYWLSVLRPATHCLVGLDLWRAC